jgi:hypothetical protein
MRSHKSTILIALLALLLSAFVGVMAQQGAPQTDQQKKAEACCAMESCCCNGDSCPMKKEGAANADAKDACCCSNGGCNMKAEGGADVAKTATTDAAKAGNADAKHACCGDSCDMMAKHDPAKHDPAKHDMANMAKQDKKEGSCCNAKHKADAKNKEMKKQ